MRSKQGYSDLKILATFYIKRAVLCKENNNNPVEDYFFAYCEVMDLSSYQPDHAMSVIDEMLCLTDDENIINNIAAGPLENLLAHHGSYVIDRIEKKANEDPKFRFLLGGVWQNIMSDEIWERVQKAIEEPDEQGAYIPKIRCADDEY